MNPNNPNFRTAEDWEALHIKSLKKIKALENALKEQANTISGLLGKYMGLIDNLAKPNQVKFIERESIRKWVEKRRNKINSILSEGEE